MIDARGVDTIGAGLSACVVAGPALYGSTSYPAKHLSGRSTRAQRGKWECSLQSDGEFRHEKASRRGRSWGDGVCRHAVYVTRSLCLSISVPIMGSSIGLAWGGHFHLKSKPPCRSEDRAGVRDGPDLSGEGTRKSSSTRGGGFERAFCCGTLHR